MTGVTYQNFPNIKLPKVGLVQPPQRAEGSKAGEPTTAQAMDADDFLTHQARPGGSHIWFKAPRYNNLS